MDADEFSDYILGFIFYKYLSEKQHLYANRRTITERIIDQIKAFVETFINGVDSLC